MQIVNFGHFKLVSTTGIMFFTNEDGLDWYDLRANLTTWDERGEFIDAVYGAWATVDPATMQLTNVEHDPSKLVPNDRIVLGIDAGPEDVQEGMVYQDGQLLPPPPVAPVFLPVSRRKLRLTLVRNDIPLAAVDAAIAAMPEGRVKDEAIIEWQDATEFEHDHPLLTMLAQQLGITQAKLDKMWREAEIA